MNMSIEVKMPRRATLTINSYLARYHDMPVGEVPCYVLGVFQEQDCDCCYPVFVCELEDGKVLNVATELIKFEREDDEA